MIDKLTKSWIRNVSDERAADAGCRFDWIRGAQAVWWMEKFCRLYEGSEYAGKPLVLWGCLDCDYSDFQATEEPFWIDDQETVPGPGYEIHEQRAVCHAECVRKGHHIDWQYECAMRCYGWTMFREKWGAWLRRFRKGSVWLPKKQKKSPTLAANSLYVFAGDGEDGQHVYLMAKDGVQSKKIAGEHAFQMVDQSPALRASFKPNLSEKSLYFHKKRSKWEPLSSSNQRTQQSKEGLNGSGFVDEAHVVDRDFIRRTDRMGISRREPLFLSFSTAGNNPDGWGKEEFDYAQKVIDGRTTNHEYLAMIYAAPQDVTDEDLDANFDKYAAMANPSLGHTIDPDEIRGDYERSKETIERLADFKMYRLNIWQQSSNPWLRLSDWTRCGAKYTEEDLLGQTCFAGLDLGFTDDTTALVLVFPVGEERYRIWPYLFTSEAATKKHGGAQPWRTWESGGHVHIFEGDTTDFPYLRRFIGETLQAKFDLRAIAYDQHGARNIAQDLQDDYGLHMEPFLQNAAKFFEPMNLFENDLVGQRIEHPNNPCLNWMVGNATKNQRTGLLEKPVDRGKKIDGVVAAIMGREMANIAAVNFWNPADGVTL